MSKKTILEALALDLTQPGDGWGMLDGAAFDALRDENIRLRGELAACQAQRDALARTAATLADIDTGKLAWTLVDGCVIYAHGVPDDDPAEWGAA